MLLWGGVQTEIDLRLVLQKRLKILGFSLRSQSLENKRNMVKHFKNNWLPYFTNGQLKPIVDSTFNLTDVAIAHQYMEENRNFGKVVLVI